MKTYKSYLVLAALLCLIHQTHAQYTEVINSNRPGVSRSAFSVGTNVVQFELGPYFLQEKHAPLDYEVSGFGVDFSARYGLFFEQLEINIEGTYQNDTFKDMRSTITSETSRSNFKTLAVGAKYLVFDPLRNAEEEKPNLYSYHANRKFKWKSLIPAVAVYAGINYSGDGNPYVSADAEGIKPKVMIATQNNFAGGWVLVMNFVKDRIGADGYGFEYIATITHSFDPQWVVFGEAQIISGDFYSDDLFRLGGAYLWSPNFQLDTAVTFNTRDTPSVFSVNFGASYRLDFHEDKEADDGTSAEDEARRKSRKRNKKRKKKGDEFTDDGGF